MTATTLDQQISSDYRQSEALHTLADMIYRGDIPTATEPGQALRISFLVPNADDVIEFAARMGIEVETAVSKGDAFTTATLYLGAGSREFSIPDYTAAVAVRVSHFEPAPVLA